jgi:hypothetical protein
MARAACGHVTAACLRHASYDPTVSYDVFLFRFLNGDTTDIDASHLMALVEPFIIRREEEHDYVRLRAADGGEADLYGVGEPAASLMFSHWSWGDICDLMAKLGRELDMVIIPPDRPAMIAGEQQRPHLPEEFVSEAVVVRAGADIQRAIAPASMGEGS